MRRAVPFAAAALMLGACATHVPDAGQARAEGLASAERAFAAAAAVSGVRAAFLGVLSVDATVFRPGPVDGRGYTASHPDSPLVLEWQPQRVSVSASGALGYSTGPYRLAPTASPEKRAYGQYFSVWQRGAAGRWELLIDQGIEEPEPAGWTLPLEIVPSAVHAAAGSVVEAEEAFADAARSEDTSALYRRFGSTRIRLLRDGRPPLDGLASVGGLPDAATHRDWTPWKGAEAESHDLAWTMGRYRSVGPGSTSDSGYYVRIWHAEGTDWKILADVLAPLDGAGD